MTGISLIKIYILLSQVMVMIIFVPLKVKVEITLSTVT